MATPGFRPLLLEWSTQRASALLPSPCVFGRSLLGSRSHPVLFGAAEPVTGILKYPSRLWEVLHQLVSEQTTKERTDLETGQAHMIMPDF